MPKLDKTGPLGAGPGTGWGRGSCGIAGAAGRGQGGAGLRGVGRGGVPRGGGNGRCFGGRGMGRRGYQFTDETIVQPVEETGALKARLAAAQDEITELRNRLEELEKKGQTQ